MVTRHIWNDINHHAAVRHDSWLFIFFPVAELQDHTAPKTTFWLNTVVHIRYWYTHTKMLKENDYLWYNSFHRIIVKNHHQYDIFSVIVCYGSIYFYRHSLPLKLLCVVYGIMFWNPNPNKTISRRSDGKSRIKTSTRTI